jgi:GcrA cell cycle regulator
MPQMNWNDEHVGALKRLVNEGFSFSECAAKINDEYGSTFTRNAVIGKAHRIGLAASAEAKHQRRVALFGERPKRVRPPRVRAAPAVQFRPRYSPEQGRMVDVLANIEPVELRTVSVASLRLSIADIEPFQCRYPDDEGDPRKGVHHTFCGHATIGRFSYCAAHARLIIGIGTSSERAASRMAPSLEVA